MAQDYGIIAAYLSLGVQALLPIALGSFKSLKVRLADPSELPSTNLSERNT